jgi:hypothetical protein
VDAALNAENKCEWWLMVNFYVKAEGIGTDLQGICLSLHCTLETLTSS